MKRRRGTEAQLSEWCSHQKDTRTPPLRLGTFSKYGRRLFHIQHDNNTAINSSFAIVSANPQTIVNLRWAATIFLTLHGSRTLFCSTNAPHPACRRRQTTSPIPALSAHLILFLHHGDGDPDWHTACRVLAECGAEQADGARMVLRRAR